MKQTCIVSEEETVAIIKDNWFSHMHKYLEKTIYLQPKLEVKQKRMNVYKNTVFSWQQKIKIQANLYFSSTLIVFSTGNV